MDITDFRGVNFWDANVRSLKLYNKELHGADLSQAKGWRYPDAYKDALYDLNTKFPEGLGFDLRKYMILDLTETFLKPVL